MEEIAIFSAVVFLIFVCIGFGYVKGYSAAIAKDSDLPDQYCFQCEFEMPVKVKNGNVRCSNCGMRHGNFG
ncbi:hypothetical protein J0383_07920 [Flavobacterium endoglycinae]|uniref:Uncharacterized protein n=1 Tax=Flavobacterium endoglycinae TaxID=2816357 RepID=A0ABX7QI26_9FLAO|nr:hypothetical protein [Flavobacterium endoglycinae]QSW90726.1 hypothetical protein J0383_07920 [Flavobacterium endoglycinae]